MAGTAASRRAIAAATHRVVRSGGAIRSAASAQDPSTVREEAEGRGQLTVRQGFRA